ncbi:MAG: hypothetical protein NXI00_11015 [Cytophagales bacterium]|nr:hypothetical protein [Cytophagales bacterium]
MNSIIKSFILVFMLMFPAGISAQVIRTIQTVSASASVSGTADVVLITSGSGITLTLPGSPATGRTIVVGNHSTADVTLSPAIRTRNGVSSAVLPKDRLTFEPGISKNFMTVIWDGTYWRLID